MNSVIWSVPEPGDAQHSAPQAFSTPTTKDAAATSTAANCRRRPSVVRLLPQPQAHAARTKARCPVSPSNLLPSHAPTPYPPQCDGRPFQSDAAVRCPRGRPASQPSASLLPHQTTLIRPRCQPLKPRQPPLIPPGIAARAELIGAPPTITRQDLDRTSPW